MLGRKQTFQEVPLRIAILAGVAALLPMTAWAADEFKPFDVKLGLWETTTTTEIAGMPAMPAMPQIPEEQLAKMPPQQRAQIEAMMKARGAGGPRTMNSKACMTRESLNRGLAFGREDNACTRKVVSSSANRQEIHMECTHEKVTTTGDMIIERVDTEHVKGTVVMKSSGSEKPLDMKMSFNTKWVSSDCGDVKPLGAK